MFTTKILSKFIKPTYVKPFLPLSSIISTFYTPKTSFSTYSSHHTLIPTTPGYNNNIPELAREWDENEGTMDKFNLSAIHDIKKLFSLLRKPDQRYGLNDFVYFLRRIVQLNDERQLHISTHNSRDLNSFITQIKNSLRSASQEYPLIGSYAWCFWKLNHCEEDQELWLTLADHIIDGRFYPNFHETMCGIEGFTALEGMADQDFIDQVYRQLENALLVTIVEVNVTHYKRIAEGLLRVHRSSDEVWDSLEQHLLHFLSSHDSVHYDLNLILDIVSSFSLSGNGSNNLFLYCQNIFNGFYDQSEDVQEEMSKGSFVAKLVQTYALAKYKHSDLVVERDLRSLMSDLILCSDARFTLEELVNLVQFCEVLELPKQVEIDKRLNNMLFDVYGQMRCEDMVRYIDLKVYKDYNGEYKDLPKDVLSFFDSYLCTEMDKQKPEPIRMYIAETEERGLMERHRGQVMDKVVEYVSKNLHVYDFETLCYFYWVFSKYRALIHYEEGKVHCQMDMIKDNIRLQSAFAKGRLLPESNFYKMLEVVSGADFLSQGEYPEW